MDALGRPATSSQFFQKQARVLPLSEGSSLRGTIFNLVNSVIGGGIVSLPFACHKCGLLLGILLLWAVAMVCAATNWMLVYCMDATRERSYSRLAEALFGSKLSVLVDIQIFLYNLGSMAGYVVIIGDLLPDFMSFMQAPEPLQDRTNLLLLSFLPLLWVSSMKELGALQHVSLVCLCLILVFTGSLVLMGTGVLPTRQPGDEPAAFWKLSASNILQQLPVILFAFSCQQNVPILYTELRRQRRCEVDSKFPTKRGKMMAASYFSMFLCAVIYSLAGGCGYWSFRQRTGHDILSNFTTDVFGAAEYVRCCYVIVIFCSYPVMAFGCVLSLHRLTSSVIECLSSGDGYTKMPPGEFFASPGGPAADVFSGEYVLPTEEHLQMPRPIAGFPRTAVRQPGEWVHLMEVIAVVAFTITTAIFVPDVSIVFGLTGSLCGSFVMYVFPALFYLRVKRDHALQVGTLPSGLTRQLSAEDEMERSLGCSAFVGYFILSFGLIVAIGSSSIIVFQALHP